MLKEKRKHYQLTQEQLAELIFVSTKTISNWETGKTMPDIDNLIRLAKLFNLSLDNLLLEGSDIVENINKDIKKGRNLKKIILFVSLPLIAITFFLSWKTYQGNNMSLVPIEELTNIEVTSDILNKNTLIKGSISTKKNESFDFVDIAFNNDIMYLMVYKEPDIFRKTTDFTVNLNSAIKNRDITLTEIQKIVLTYFDTNELDGYDYSQLTQEFPQKIIWEK